MCCVALEKEQAVAGFINTHKDGLEFTTEDVYKYITSLWNAGCGPVRLNFRKHELINYINRCDTVCLRQIGLERWRIDKSLLSDQMSQEEKVFLHNNKDLAKSFDLFCRLQVDLRTPEYLLAAMGFRFIYK